MYKAYQTPEQSFIVLHDENEMFGVISFAPAKYADIINLGRSDEDILGECVPLDSASEDTTIQVAWDALKASLSAVIDICHDGIKVDLANEMIVGLGM